MDSGRLRRKDTTKGPPLRILSLGEYRIAAPGRNQLHPS